MSNLKQDDIQPMNFKPDWNLVEEAGDYAFTVAMGFEVLVMRCPFCNSEQPTPPMFGHIKVKNPLTIDTMLTCGICERAFIIDQGVAFGTK